MKEKISMKRIRFYSKEIKAIKEYQVRNGLFYFAQAVRRIVREHLKIK